VLLMAVPAFFVSSRAQVKHQIVAGQVKEINVERLPDLNIPRSTHTTLCINDEFVTFGGHTTGYIPTPTAEYYRDGEWHVMDMVYAHDGGVVLPMKLGKVLLAGGFEKHLGIGQTFVVERYDPMTHSFKGFGCLNHKRAIASAVEMDDGRVIISGNWYDADAIEQFDGHKTFSFLKQPAVHRASPFMLRMRNGNVLIFGSLSSRDKEIPGDYMVDQLLGDAFHVPLLDTWRPLPFSEQDVDKVHWFIGDESKGRYAYLIPVCSTEGEMGLVHVEDTTFTLLPTAEPIPTYAGDKEINYFHSMVIDRAVQRAYMIGYAGYRCYLVSIDYAKHPAPVAVSYTDSIPVHASTITLAPNGDILMVGGIKDDDYNFNPVGIARLLKVGQADAAMQSSGGNATWPWLVGTGLLLVVAVTFAVFLLLRKRKTAQVSPVVGDTEPEVPVTPEKNHQVSDAELIEMIMQVMEEQQPYLDAEFKLSELSDLVHVNNRYVPNCIKRKKGCSFSQFVNTYRIDHAKRLLLENREISCLPLLSGQVLPTTPPFSARSRVSRV